MSGPEAENASHDPIFDRGSMPSVSVLSDLRRLHAFVVVADELHFHHAAERLMMAQSPLSRIIKNLEEELGVMLFERDRRHVRLTAAGEALLAAVRPLLVQMTHVVHHVRSIGRVEA